MDETHTPKKEFAVYAARLKDLEALSRSSSGGAFTALSDCVLKNGGAVVCSVYNYAGHEMCFQLITDQTQRDQARGSKYIQSDLCGIYQPALRWTEENPDKELLFVGTGCQAAAFRKFLEQKGITDRTYIVDLVCQGVSSPRIWRQFMELIERKTGAPVESVTFKDKRWGWKSPFAWVRSGAKKVHIDNYVQMINTKNPFRPSCYTCPYAAMERRSDLTIGDFWGIDARLPEFYSPLGNSLILVQSARGAALLRRAQPELELRSSTREACVQPNLLEPVAKPAAREQFWDEFKRLGVAHIVQKYGHLSANTRLRLLVKWILGVKNV